MPTQQALPFEMDHTTLETFLAQWCALEEAMDDLREQQRQLVEEFKPVLPLRGVRTAVKIVRARQKLEGHAKEPLTLAQQGYLEGVVERWLLRRDLERKQFTREVEAFAGAKG